MQTKNYLLTIILVSLLILSNCNVQAKALDPLDILVVQDGPYENLITRLSLDSNFQLDITTFPNDLTSYEGIILLDYTPSTDQLAQLRNFEGGVLIVAGEQLAANATVLVELGLTSNTSGQFLNSSALPVTNKDIKNPITQNIQWNSAPTINNFINFGSVSSIPGETVILTSHTNIYANIPLVITAEDGQYLTTTFALDDSHYNSMGNKELFEWPFFNYFLYLSVLQTTDIQPISYAGWPYSPVPHLQDSIFLGLVVVVVSLFTLLGYKKAKQYAKNNPLSDKDLQEMQQKQTNEQDTGTMTVTSDQHKKGTEWEEVGLHRQLGGFLVQLFIGLAIILPNVIMSSIVFPVIILPSPQGAGFYDFTIHFFEALWFLFDLGTSTMMVTFFSKYRIKRPQYAIRFVQMFIWYQMISGIAQLFLVSFLGSLIFPHTFLAHLSWIFVTHAFFQWPAFFIVFMLFFQAMNRHDLYQILNLLLYAIFNITLQYAMVYLFRITLGQSPIFGEALAGAIGYSIGYYVIQVATFFIGLWFFKRLGFSLKNIFRVDFTWKDIKDGFTFGSKWAFGKIWPPLGWFIQIFLLSIFVPNYTQQQGYFSLAWNFALIVMLAGLFANSMLSGVSESYHAGKKKLSRYYAVSSLKWSAYFDWFFVAILLAIGYRFILGGAGMEWEGAAIILPWLLIFHFFGFPSWLGDWFFAGSDRTGWAAVSWIIEQIGRIVLLIIFVPFHEFFTLTFNSPMVAVMFAYIPALIVKNLFVWWRIRKDDHFQFLWSDYIWQGLVAPFLTGIVVYGIFEVVSRVIWQGEILTSIVLLLLATGPGLYIFAFIFGIFGGFDDGTLSEFEKASEITSSGIKPFARLLYKVTALGASISPLHNKFPITCFAEASQQAKEIQYADLDILKED